MVFNKLRLVVFGLLVMLLSACAAGGQSGDQAGQPALAGTQWILSSMNGNPPLEGSTVTLTFEQENFGGRSGCNTYGGDYSAAQDGKLTLGSAVMTEMACMEPAGVMEQETTFVNTLTQAASYQIDGDQLEVKNADGDTILVFTKQ